MALTQIKLGGLAANSVDSDAYVDGSIDNAHLADDAANSDEIAAGAIDLAHMSVNSIDSDQYVDGSIDAAHLASSSVTSAKLNIDAGIAFPASASAQGDANTLDDYEEGTFTASFASSSSGSINKNTSQDLCRYTKIGRMVHVHGFVGVSSVSGDNSGAATLTGLPFTVNANTDGEVSGNNAASLWLYGFSSGLNVVQARAATNTTTFDIKEFNGATHVEMADHFAADGQFAFSCSYTV